jgi:flagellar basal-body rod protein FlgG
MDAQQTRMDFLSNDISNLNTTGYRSQRVAFKDLVYSAEQGVPIGAGSTTMSLGPTLDQGSIEQTDNPLSLALSGPGFFQVKQADGTPALTRDGTFALDANGNLVTSTGEKLDPPVQVPKGAQPADISISASGDITVAGKSIGRITVVDVPSSSGLQPVGDNLFVANAASGKPTPTSTSTTQIQQGALETSNVDLAQTMADMIDAQRGYELASKAIQTQDQLLDDANNIVR